MSHIKKVYVMTTESIDFLSLNHDIAAAIQESGADSGVVHVVVPKSGAGLMVFKKLTEVCDALKTHLESTVPSIQSTLLPRSFVCPFTERELLLAPYEELFLVDCEPRAQRREVIVAIMPEAEAKTE